MSQATRRSGSNPLWALRDMGLVCNDRGAAELALTALQRLKVTPSTALGECVAGRAARTT